MIGEVISRETTNGPVVLVGHSMGGILAQLHAIRAPHTVSRLVLLDPPVPNLTRWRRDPKLTAKLVLLRSPGLGALVARRLSRMTPEELVDQQLANATPHTDRIPRIAIEATVAETRERVATGLAKDGQRAQWDAILEIVALLAQPAAWRERLAGITAPTLWLHGEDDPLADLTAAAALAASQPDWTFRTRVGVGHLPQLEDPVWTFDLIGRWLRTWDQ